MQLESLSKNKVGNSKKRKKNIYLHNFVIAHANDINLFPQNKKNQATNFSESIFNLFKSLQDDRN